MPILTMFASATAQSAAAGERCCTELKLIAFAFLPPIEDLATYSFNTHTAKDYFCKTCGILPFRQPRTGPGLWSVNIRCLPDVDLGAIPIKYVYGSRLS